MSNGSEVYLSFLLKAPMNESRKAGAPSTMYFLNSIYNRVYFSIRKTTLRYISPFQDPHISLVINVYFLIYFFVYLESGGRFKIEIEIWI